MRILNTERLALRWFTEDDAAFMLGLLNEPGWIQNISDPEVRDLEQARRWIAERLVHHYWLQGHGFWAVERRSDGELLGLCGIFKRDSLQHPDIGYAFAERHWGHGYAREAALACRQYATEVLGLRHLQAITGSDNTRSGSVLQDIGFRDLGLQDIPGYDSPSRLYDWQDLTPEGSDEQQIDALVQRFFAAFTNQGGALPQLAALPFHLLPSAVVSCTTAQGLLSYSVREFIEPRAELLNGGQLQDFAEWEVEHETRRHGAIAQRWLRYRKRGVLRGQAFEGEGLKTLQLVKTPRGWKIAALAWEDLP